jgi:NACHT domain
MAGTGKSTIARTIARSFSAQRRLGASFFFSRGGGDLGHAGKFVTTLAYQLANTSSSLKHLVCDALAEQNIITQKDLRSQWKELILRPLSGLGAGQHHFVIVVDALDECDREDDIRLILQLMIEANDLTNTRLQVFLTSRPETAMRLGFRDMLEILHQDLDLRDIPLAIVEHDISVYLRHELGRIRKERNLSTDWPEDEIIRLLVKRSDRLFIYVATVCRFIGNRRWDPQKRLPMILHGTAGKSHTANLDEMYSQVLEHSVIECGDGEEKDELCKRFRQIVGPIVVLFDVLSVSVLASLLSIPIEDIDLALDPLYSVLDIPKHQHLPIRLLHPSFRDFLLDKRRCRNDYFWIDQERIHINLAENCLRLLSITLKKDICNLKTPGVLAYEVHGSSIDSHLPRYVQYACCYWVDHLNYVNPIRRNEIGLHDNGKFHVFLENHFLHWLEALSLMKKVPEGVLMITKLESMIEVCSLIPPRDKSITDLLDISMKIQSYVLWFTMQSDSFFKTG